MSTSQGDYSIWSKRILTKHTACSSSNKMPAAVKAAIQSSVVTEGGKTEEEAADYVLEMERSGRLVEESWT